MSKYRKKMKKNVAYKKKYIKLISQVVNIWMSLQKQNKSKDAFIRINV